jgi:hypothetical protein
MRAAILPCIGTATSLIICWQKVREIAAMLKMIRSGENIVAARETALTVTEELPGRCHTRSAALMNAAFEEMLSCYTTRNDPPKDKPRMNNRFSPFL